MNTIAKSFSGFSISATFHPAAVLSDAFSQFFARQNTRHQLKHLDDKMLRDIGLRRDELGMSDAHRSFSDYTILHLR